MEKDPIDEVLDIIYTKYSKKYVKEAFKILEKLFFNIINNPDDEKYKNFKKTNPNIKLKVLLIEEAIGFLLILGYEKKDDEFLVFKGDISRLKYATNVLKNYIEKIEKMMEEEKRIEEEKRQEEIRKQMDEVNKKYMMEKLEKERLLQQCKNDRKEMSQRIKPTDSVAKKMNYGAHEVKVEFKCSGGGGR